jgi:4a-hydroxytetrahydrobiopterin dehydratase
MTLTRTAASGAVEQIGWRYLLGAFATSLAVSSLDQAVRAAAVAVAACGDDADEHLRADVRPDRLELTLQTAEVTALTERDVALAHAITDAVRGIGLDTASTASSRPVQSLEIGIDAMDIPAIRPFWKAVLGYVGEPGLDGPDDAVIDPVRQGPAVWFQQMDEPREQRNRIHFDVTVSNDEADARVAAALAAGGRLLTDRYARSFWVLADAEGNEVCVCTWQDRD